MPARDAASRTAIVAGGSGLVGRALLALLLAELRYRQVHLLLRRAVDDLPANDRLHRHLVDFDRLSDPMPAAGDVYCCLGTTLKVAGSEAAFRRVDFDAVVEVARAARVRGAERIAVVSSLGANARSRVFYNRVKGEMEDAIQQLGYPSVVIAQPSLLAGDRAALGQPPRLVEQWALHLLRPVIGLMPRKLRPIVAATVAQAMLQAVLDGRPGVRVLGSNEMQSSGA